jgi:transcription antitermination factor NusG
MTISGDVMMGGSLAEPRPHAHGLLWYAIHTRPRHEKRVAQQLAEKRLESFLPLREEVHRWKDRMKEVSLPLFPGYVFVRTGSENRQQIVRLPGVVRFIGFGGTPAAIPEIQVATLRHAIQSGTAFEQHPYLQVGQRVKVCRGPLQGTAGILVRCKGVHRLVLSIDIIQRSIAVEVDVREVLPAEPVEPATTVAISQDEVRSAATSLRR